MNHREYREKYGDGVKTNNYTYPDYFFSPWDDFTLHIPNWDVIHKPWKGTADLTFLELGTANGRAAHWMCSEVLHGNNSTLHTVDQFKIQRYKPKKNWHIEINEEIDIDVTENLSPYLKNDKCKFFQSTTLEFLHESSDMYDFIYIDASHEPIDVLADATHSFTHLKEGGLLLFDDYGWGNCRFGIEAFLLAYNDNIKVIFKEYQVAIQKIK